MSKTIIALDSTQIKEYLTCEVKWNLGYIENLRRWNSKKKALDMGTFVHKLLETFYILRINLPKEDRWQIALTVISLFKDGKLGQASGLTEEEIKFILERFNQYVMKWTAYDFTPLKIGSNYGVELGFSKIIYEDEWKVFILEGKIDLISRVTFDGAFCFVDNKTQGRYSTLYGHKPQFKTYALATGYNYGIVNYFKLDKTYKENETFRRDMFYYSNEEIADWKDYLIKEVFTKIYKAMLVNGVNSVADLKANMLKLNFSSCGGMWETNPCYFTSICEAPCRLREHIKKNHYFKVPKWTPWELSETDE